MKAGVSRRIQHPEAPRYARVLGRAIVLCSLSVIPFACSHGGRDVGSPERPATATIAVGESWTHAQRLARSMGYAVTSTATLEYAAASGSEPSQGFYITLPRDRALLVWCDPKTGRIVSMEVVSNWSVSKSAHVYTPVQAFDLAE